MPKKAKEPVGVIMRRPLDTDAGSSFLFITRSSGDPFQRTGTAIFAVDSVKVDEKYVLAMTEHGPIMFNNDIPYLVVPRALCRPVQIKELAKIQIDEKAEWDKAYADLPAEEPAATVESTLGTGNYL